MTPELLTSVDDADWLALRMELWPDGSKQEHLEEMASFLAQPERFAQFIVKTPGSRAAGFVEAAIRAAYVNGTRSSPVAFLEGLYVRFEARRKGVARSLVAAVSEWAIARGCVELASDTELANVLSQAVHERLGFAETERVVYFSKTLRPKVAN